MDPNSLQPNQRPTEPGVDSRKRVQVTFSDPVLLLLSHVSAQLGPSLAQICESAVLDQLPVLLERADQVKRRAGELGGQARAQAGKK